MLNGILLSKWEFCRHGMWLRKEQLPNVWVTLWNILDCGDNEGTHYFPLRDPFNILRLKMSAYLKTMQCFLPNMIPFYGPIKNLYLL